MKQIAAAITVVLATCHAAHAEVRELTQAGLRTAIVDNRAIPSFELINAVEVHTGEPVVHVRAFDVSGAVIYRVLIKQKGGALGAILLDGESGHVVLPSTRVGQKIAEFAGTVAPAATGSEGHPLRIVRDPMAYTYGPQMDLNE